MLSIKPFRRLWIATSLSSLGDWLSLLALTAEATILAKRGVAAQASAVGAVWLTSLLPALLLGPLAGAVADRLDRRMNMIINDVLRAALYASIPLNLAFGLVNELTWIYVVQFLASCCSLFWTPPRTPRSRTWSRRRSWKRPTSTACSPRSAPLRWPVSSSACSPWSAGRSAPTR